MNITFLGVGEAFDNVLPNNSHLLVSPEANILFDCGYSVPQQWFKLGKDADFLDAIWISHKHGDHFLGLPAVLMRMWEGGRTKPLTVICQNEHAKFFEGITDMAYRGFTAKFGYEMNFVGVKAGQKMNFQGLDLSFAPTVHSIENLAVKVVAGAKSYCYSGDGQFLVPTEKLYADCDLVIQETYLYDERKVGHTCITDAIAMAGRLGVKALALTHLQRDFRRLKMSVLHAKIKSKKVNIFIPEPMDEYSL